MYTRFYHGKITPCMLKPFTIVYLVHINTLYPNKKMIENGLLIGSTG